MRIEQSVIDEIKSNHDVVSFIRSKGVVLRKTGKVYVGLCPFHKDTKPSLFIDPQKQLWNCLGACSAAGKNSGGDLITFLMKYEGCNFRDAVTKLAPIRPIKIPEESRLKNPAIFSQVIERYHRSFLESITVQEYISSRGIDPVLAKQYKAGYVDGSLLEIVSKETIEWRILQEIGIVTSLGSELMAGCIVFPLTALNQYTVGLYGRSITKDQHLYLPGPRRGLFNWNIAKTFEEIFLTESIIDALSFIQAGFTNVVPVYGINGLTRDHIDFMIRFGIKKMIIALDSDDAGRKAATAIAEKLSNTNIQSQTVELPAKDANELLKKEGVDGFKKAIADLLSKNLRSNLAIVRHEMIPTQAQPSPTVIAETATEGELAVTAEDRAYRIKGIPKKTYNRLRVALKLSVGNSFYLDTVDLLSARNRGTFAARCAAHFEIPKPIIEKDLYVLLEAIESYQKQPEAPVKLPKQEMTESEKTAGLQFLKSSDLLDEIATEMEALGYVGEEANKKLGYLASISRFLEEPLSIVILSQSGSGKSALAEVLETLTAPEDKVMFSRITPQALYYMEKDSLCHKFVIIEERAGSAEADYSIRTLQSKKRLILAAPIKDPNTGKIQTTTFEILGPTAFLETTTSPRINHENSTRCFEMYLNETIEQTRKIHHLQRFLKTAEGRRLKMERDSLLSKHHNAQRLLQRVLVHIPYATAIEFPDGWLRTRRDHQRFLNLIEVIAFLYQYQKETKIDGFGNQCIEADFRDYEMACHLAEDILPETLSDMKKPVSDLLEIIEKFAEGLAKNQKVSKYEITFTRRAIREETGLPNYRIKELFHELEELEYLEVEKSPRGGTYQYKLTEGKKRKSLNSALLTVEQLKEKIQ